MEHFYEKIFGYSGVPQKNLLEFVLNNLEKKENLRIAEIGVYMGKCTAMWNVMLINKNITYEYYAIDHFLGSAEHDKNTDYYTISLNNLSPILDKIRLIKNDSLLESKNYSDEFFDMVYIDASHDYESVKKDILSWYPKVKKGGFITGDDYVQVWQGVIQAVNEIFPTNVHVSDGQWCYQKK